MTMCIIRLARVLDTLPNGFPATESGIEIQAAEEDISTRRCRPVL